MEFVEGVIDLGAEEINVTGIASIERISDGQVRVTYFVRRKGQANTAVHLIWDRSEWLRAWSVWDEARPEITSPNFEIVGTAEQYRQAH